LFNNAAQSFNHAFYWESIKPGGGGVPTGPILELLQKDFGSYENFRKEFVAKALTAFGSGWAWLVWTPAGLKVTNTIGANTPLTDEGSVPLLTVDVWEHAYYLDYQNLRNEYVDAFLDHLVNWDKVTVRLP
jgi:Fe-Mn family superoxide dismutase